MQTLEEILALAQASKWNEILPTQYPELNEAIRLQAPNIIESILSLNYDLALLQAVADRKRSIIHHLLPYIQSIHTPGPAEYNGQGVLSILLQGMEWLILWIYSLSMAPILI